MKTMFGSVSAARDPIPRKRRAASGRKRISREVFIWRKIPRVVILLLILIIRLVRFAASRAPPERHPVLGKANRWFLRLPPDSPTGQWLSSLRLGFSATQH